MELEKSPQTPPPAPYEGGEGCLTAAIRIPVRIVVLVLVVPVRMLWDLLVVCARAIDRLLLRPVGRALGWLGRTLVVIPVTWLFEKVLTPLALGAFWLAAFVAKALFVWPWVALWRFVVVPVVTYGLVVPATWIYRQLLTPLGHGIAWAVSNLLVAPLVWIYRTLLTPAGHGIAAALAFVAKALFVWPWVALWRYVVVPVVTYGLVIPAIWIYRQLLTPIGHGIAWLLRTIGHGFAVVCRGLWAAAAWLVMTLLVAPFVWMYRRILAPVGREIVAAFGVAWRVAGYISRAVGRALRWLAWNLAGRPVSWFYRSVCTPVGHFVRDAVWRPAKQVAVEAGRQARAALASARDTVRQARRDAWRALVGGPRQPEAVPPAPRQARNLGGTQHTQTVPGVAAGPEISLHKRG
ncbi:hypothetical protein [Streptomyces sp. NPDC002889]|uniref:hypothetical protein n=1 Tax=Streptomyces sp. NPDC002889 TaxID=3364669 RepID=UPI0036CCD1CC